MLNFSSVVLCEALFVNWYNFMFYTEPAVIISMMSYHGSQTVSVSSRRGQYISCRVLMLDDTEHAFDVPVGLDSGIAYFHQIE
jgi:hypothetical protein